MNRFDWFALSQASGVTGGRRPTNWQRRRTFTILTNKNRNMENHSRNLIRLVLVGIFLFASGLLTQAENPPPSFQAGGWSSIGAMPAPIWDGRFLVFQGKQGTLAITPLSDEVVRVRFTTAKSFGRDYSYAVVDHDLEAVAAKVEIGSNITTLATASLRVIVQQAPLRISFANSAGEILDADDPESGIALAGDQFRVAKRLLDDEHVYGFGEKNGRLDKRGWQLGGYNYVMWNTDTYMHDSSTDPMYVSVPFYLSDAPRPGTRYFSRQHLAQFF